MTLTGGTYIVAFNDDPDTLAALEYMSSPEYANNRIEAGGSGFLSPNQEHDTSLYASPLDQTLAEILVTADLGPLDGSDAMPPEVGAGTFWSEGTDWVLGGVSLQEFLDNVEVRSRASGGPGQSPGAAGRECHQNQKGDPRWGRCCRPSSAS